MTSVTENQMTFKELEKSFFQMGCEITVGILQQVLEELDEEIS